MNTIVVARLAAEGEGMEILGREDGGQWSFWRSVSSVFDAGEHDDGRRSKESRPVTELTQVLPANWPLLSPVDLHPAVLDWFRTHYEAAVAALSPGDRVIQAQYRERHWWRTLAGHRMPCFSGLSAGPL